MAPKFSFDNALMHFVRHKAPGSFLWKFIVAYVCLYGSALAITGLLVGNAYLRIIQMSFDPSGAPTDQQEVAEFLTAIGLMYAVLLPLILVMWSMLEASVQRRYIRGAGFTIGLGADEFRLMGVALLWFVTFLGLYLGIIIAVAVPIGIVAAAAGDSGGALAGIFAVIGVFGALALLIWVLVRLSPAAALTIRDRQIRFVQAWGATKSRFWPLLGALVIVMIVGGLMSGIVQSIGMTVFGGYIAANFDSLSTSQDMSFLMSPMIWIGAGIILIGYLAAQAVTHFVVAGVLSLAAITDPRGGNPDVVSDAFS